MWECQESYDEFRRRIRLVESDAQRNVCHSQFSARGKRTITLTVNHLETECRFACRYGSRYLQTRRKSSPVPCRVRSRVSGTRNCYTIKNYPNTVIPSGQSDGQTVSSVKYSSTSSAGCPLEEYFYIVPKFEAILSSNQNIADQVVGNCQH